MKMQVKGVIRDGWWSRIRWDSARVHDVFGHLGLKNKVPPNPMADHSLPQ